jgi:hypothetical protein
MRTVCIRILNLVRILTFQMNTSMKYTLQKYTSMKYFSNSLHEKITIILLFFQVKIIYIHPLTLYIIIDANLKLC